jgi:hypothetical protein
MSQRRGFLVSISRAALGGLAWLFARGEVSAQAAKPADNFDDRLSSALAGLSKRVYSEEGVAMFLACENRTAKQTLPTSSLNSNIQSAFRRSADAWHRMHPQAPAKDAAKIVELLAYQDFANGGHGSDL